MKTPTNLKQALTRADSVVVRLIEGTHMVIECIKKHFNGQEEVNLWTYAQEVKFDLHYSNGEWSGACVELYASSNQSYFSLLAYLLNSTRTVRLGLQPSVYLEESTRPANIWRLNAAIKNADNSLFHVMNLAHGIVTPEWSDWKRNTTDQGTWSDYVANMGDCLHTLEAKAA